MHMQTLTHRQVQRQLQALGNEKVAIQTRKFFRTGPGEYGQGDRFLGVAMPTLRRLARECDALPLDDVRALLHSPWHESRLLALLVLVRMYQRGDAQQQRAIYRLYLDHTAQINNWDLVDVSAELVVGAHLINRSRRPLQKLARSESLWERRIALLATFHFIKRGEFEPTLTLVQLLLNDPHDLIHKAAGWMLREIAKRDEATARAFLDQHAAQMPRTMLRYAIERFAPSLRQQYRRQK